MTGPKLVASAASQPVQQKPLCEVCKQELDVNPPPLQPQICNGLVMSTMAMINGTAECPGCGAKYVTQIANIQLNVGLVKLQEESKIVEPPAAFPDTHV